MLSAVSFGDTYKLGSHLDAGACRRVQAVLEVRGELRLNADGRELDTLPLEVEGRFIYDERILQATDDPWQRRAARRYQEASAKIKAGDGLVNRGLAPDHRLIVATVDGTDSSLFSPHGPLCREELDLIDIQGNSLLVEGVLPTAPVKIGDTWQPDDRKLARLFGWAVVTQSGVTARLANVQDRVALIEITGRLDGAVGGVSTEIEFNAKCNFDLDRHLLTWFAASLREKRSIGHAEPGFEVTARLRLAMQPSTVPLDLSEETLAGIVLEPDSGADLLSFESAYASYRLIHDRRWRSMIDRHDLSVFRLVDRGDLIAQCNITELPDVEPGRHLSLEEFQGEIQQKLGEHFGQVVEASQAAGEGGSRVLRVVVSGTASEIPIQWIYYHISSREGRRAAIAFTFESELAERFAEADRTLVETFEFLPRPEPEEARNTRDESRRS